MRVDLYRRPEANHHVSYLAVPAGQPIPEEATNTDWARCESAIDAGAPGQGGADWARYGIDHPGEQIAEKGYAITSVRHMPEA